LFFKLAKLAFGDWDSWFRRFREVADVVVCVSGVE
jgi:hypothetical protein